MELRLERKHCTDRAATGNLSMNGIFECYTLEDVVRAPGVKLFGRTAVPAGVYKVEVDHSQRFGRYMPHVLDVPGFTGIRIHSGNVDTDTEGCILVGMELGVNCLFQSRGAFANFFYKLAASTGGVDASGTPVFQLREPTTLTIINRFAAPAATPAVKSKEEKKNETTERDLM